MMRRFLGSIAISATMLAAAAAPCGATERMDARDTETLDRGLVALERGDGSVFLGWRAFPDDSEDTAFKIEAIGGDGNIVALLSTRSNNTVHSEPGTEGRMVYELSAVNGEGVVKGDGGRAEILLDGEADDCIRIPMRGDYGVKRVGVADLDGDSEYEYVIQQPNFNTDPYQRPGYWKKSPTTYKIEAYEMDGTMLWRHDMGWSIEAGTWYAPWVVYDVDGDGKAEVYCKGGEGDPRDEKGLVQSGPEYLLKLDGVTGEVVAKTDWLPREGYQDYNRYCRNFLTVAYLDGKRPSLIMQRGTYRLIRTRALDAGFNVLWQWEAGEGNSEYRGQGSHGLISADVDEDGRDELVIGAAVIDDNGEGLWSLGMGHPDVCYTADIDPDNPGLEIYYGFESRQDTDGICVVDAKTGRKLWTHKKPTRHIHGQGMAADVLADYPGMETYSGERDYDERWLYSSKGELIGTYEDRTLTPRAVWWDADEQKEVAMDGGIRDWDGGVHTEYAGRIIGIADCLGDAREELITSLDGEIRIYTTTIPSEKTRPCLMTDRQYRLGVAAQTMGYFYPAQLGLGAQ